MVGNIGIFGYPSSFRVRKKFYLEYHLYMMMPVCGRGEGEAGRAPSTEVLSQSSEALHTQ